MSSEFESAFEYGAYTGPRSARTRWTPVLDVETSMVSQGPAVRYNLTALFLGMGFEWHRSLMFREPMVPEVRALRKHIGPRVRA
jgi:hypothetical protein